MEKTYLSVFFLNKHAYLTFSKKTRILWWYSSNITTEKIILRAANLFSNKISSGMCHSCYLRLLIQFPGFFSAFNLKIPSRSAFHLVGLEDYCLDCPTITTSTTTNYTTNKIINNPVQLSETRLMVNLNARSTPDGLCLQVGQTHLLLATFTWKCLYRIISWT